MKICKRCGYIKSDTIKDLRDDVAELLVKEAKDTVWLNRQSTFWEAFEDMLEKKYGLKPVGWTPYSRKAFEKKMEGKYESCKR